MKAFRGVYMMDVEERLSRLEEDVRMLQASIGAMSLRRRTFNKHRELYKAVCADCGMKCTVPFKPRASQPIYCRECYQKHRRR